MYNMIHQNNLPSFLVDTDTSYEEFKSALSEGYRFDLPSSTMFNRTEPQCVITLTDKYIQELNTHDIIYGKNKEANIVNISVKDETVHIFKETPSGVMEDTVPYLHWVLGKDQYNKTFNRLEGTQPFKWIKEYNVLDYQNARSSLYKLGTYTIYNQTENFMAKNGHTYFKNMKVCDVSLLSFDIETTGLNPNATDAQVLLITNTFRRNGIMESRTFCVNDFISDADMIHSWCDWVRYVNPSLLIGHNIVMFDLPYLNTRYFNETGNGLLLGRNTDPIIIDERTKELRKDGSQSYTYHRISCFGRDIVDTFFLAIKADIARKYDSYRLKTIIAQEGMEEAGRVHYDASKIKSNWHIPEEREKIISYGEADSRDPIKLFDLMGNTFFYLCPVVPKQFQTIIESATGSQLNAVMVRSYLQHDHSIAEASAAGDFQGAISFAVPGIYRNMFKIDFSALYPSIMRQYKLHDEKKDPKQHFITIVEYFHEYRQQYKKLYTETKEKFYDDMQNVAKVVANSCYGFLATNGLNYNAPDKAAFITAKGREFLVYTIKWATNKDLTYWTDLFIEKTNGNT